MICAIHKKVMIKSIYLLEYSVFYKIHTEIWINKSENKGEEENILNFKKMRENEKEGEKKHIQIFYFKMFILLLLFKILRPPLCYHQPYSQDTTILVRLN